MQSIDALEVGCMFWAERDTVAEVAAMGVRCGQLGIGGEVDISAEFVTRMKADVASHGMRIVTVFAAYVGESYANAPAVQHTVGFIPHSTRSERLQRTLQISNFAAKLGVDSIACHIGVVPENRIEPDYIDVRDMVREVCDHAASRGQTFALETGQEPARALHDFIDDVERVNLKVNFDPANMILYGSGDPHEAFRILAPHVISVHAKDGDWPSANDPKALGRERPLGKGAVNFPKFIMTLKDNSYRGPLCVEREAEDAKERLSDMRAAVPFLRGLI